MKFSRRDFIHAGCAIGAASLIPDAAEAWIHGTSLGALNLSRTVINVPSDGQLYLNIAKRFFFNVLPGSSNQTTDGYPTNGTLGAGVTANVAFPDGYYGQFLWKWTGAASMQSVGIPWIVYSGGASVFEIQTASGDGAGNMTIAPPTGSGGVTAPRIVFNYGWNIQQISDSGISNGHGGNLALVTVKNGFFSSGFTGTTVGISGTGTSQDGVVTTLTSQNGTTTFTLDNSTYVSGSGVAGTAIFVASNASLNLQGGQTFNNFANLVVCKTGDETNITSGLIWDTVFVNQLRYLMQSGSRGNPGWLRWMDLTAVQGSYEGDFVNRMPVSAMSYNKSRYVNGYYTGSLAWNAGDAYTCSNPSYSAAQGWTGAYQDGEIVQGQFSVTNVGGNPTLTVSGRPTAPIFNQSIKPFIFRFSQAIGSANISSGTYNTSTGQVVLTLSSTIAGGTLASGHAVSIQGLTGTGANLASLNGSYTTIATSGGTTVTYTAATGLGAITITGGFFSDITAGTGLTLSWTFNAGGVSWLNGGSNYTFTYTTVAGDVGNIAALNNNVQNAINGNAVLNPVNNSSAIQATNSAELAIYPPTQMANGTTGATNNILNITYTAGPAICTIIRMDPSTLYAGGGIALVYNSLLGGFIYTNAALISSIPIEAIVELCNRVGAHCWYNWGITKSAWVTAVTNYMATNLSAGLRFGTEVGNELWNPFANPLPQYLGLGGCLGWSVSNGDQSILAYGGLRTVQFSTLSRAAWVAAGRTASDHLVFSMAQVSDYATNGNTAQYQWAGVLLKGSVWPFYASFGGLNGSGAVGDHFAAGTRPIDASDGIGYAPYWGSPWFGGVASGNNGALFGTAAQNAPMLQASLDFANGLFSTAYTELVNQFNGTTQRSDGNTGNVLGPIFTGSFGTSYVPSFNGFEAIAASYDSFRVGAGLSKLGIFNYEGGPQWAMGANGISGVNSVNATDISALANQIGPLGLNWSPSAYTQTGTPVVSSGSYNSGTGVVTLTLATAIKYSAAATFTGSISGNTLTVASGLTGTLNIGQTIGGAGVTAAIITSFGTGTGGIGTYGISVQQSIGSQTITAGDTLTVNLTGTGSVSSLNGTFVATPTTGGTTVTYKAGTGLTLTITGGTVFDQTAANWEIATNIITMAQGWKHDASYKNFIKASYYQQLQTISGINREVHPAQYGYNVSQWGLFPGFYSANNPYTNYDAIHEWNA
jgi:hypothetical protein